MPEIYKNTVLDYGGGFTVNRGIISSVGGRLDGTLMQQIGVQYAQRATPVYELGPAGQTARFYYVSGRSNGALNVGHILGPPVALASYYQDFSDVCNAARNIVDFGLGENACGFTGEGGSLSGSNRGMKAKFALLVQVSIGAGADNLLINEGSQLMFGNMEYNGR